jgi:hypothetical protein
MKKYSKTQGRTMLLPTILYAGPPFCRALAISFSFCHPELIEGSRGLHVCGMLLGLSAVLRCHFGVVKCYCDVVICYCDVVR